MIPAMQTTRRQNDPSKCTTDDNLVLPLVLDLLDTGVDDKGITDSRITFHSHEKYS